MFLYMKWALLKPIFQRTSAKSASISFYCTNFFRLSFFVLPFSILIIGAYHPMFHVISFIQWRVYFSLSRISRSNLCIYFLWGFQLLRFHNNSSDRQQWRVEIYSRKLIGSLLDVENNNGCLPLL